MANTPGWLQLLADATAGIAQDTAGLGSAGGQWLYGQARGEPISASDALMRGRESVTGMDYERGPEGDQSLRELINALGGTAQAMNMGIPGAKGSLIAAGRKGGEALESIDPDVLAGAEILSGGADVIPGVGAALSALPFLGRVSKGSKFADEIEDIITTRLDPEDYEKGVTFIEADTVVPDVGRRIGTTGQYRGAPKGVASPQRLGSMRTRLKGLLEEGTPGRDWYQESTESGKKLTGNRRNYKHLAAGANAITSRGAAVPSNRLFGVKGFNQAIAGQPVKAGRFPNVQGESIEKLASGETYYGGPKETPFYEGLTIDERGNIRPTNDLWMARAFQYKRKNPKTGEMEEWSEGLGQAQHRFMDAEINGLVDYANDTKMGGHSDWTPERVQASIWVAQKARDEGTTVASAMENFSHGLDDLTSNIRWEAAPAPGLEHMPGVSREPEYQELVEAMVQNPEGQDLLALESGMLTRPSVPGFGSWAGESNPSTATRVLAAPVTKGTKIDPGSEGLVNAIAASRGMNVGQEAVGTTFQRKPKLAGDRNIARVRIGETPGAELMPEMENKLVELFGINPVTDGPNVIAVHTDDGIQAIVDGKVDPNTFTKGMKVFGKEFGGEVELGANSGRLVGNDAFSGFKPSIYMREIDEAGLSPESIARVERGAVNEARVLERMDDALAANIPDAGVRSELLQKTRQILSQEGFAGIRKAVEAGILPAIVLSVLVGSQGQPEPGVPDA